MFDRILVLLIKDNVKLYLWLKDIISPSSATCCCCFFIQLMIAELTTCASLQHEIEIELGRMQSDDGGVDLDVFNFFVRGRVIDDDCQQKRLIDGNGSSRLCLNAE